MLCTCAQVVYVCACWVRMIIRCVYTCTCCVRVFMRCVYACTCYVRVLMRIVYTLFQCLPPRCNIATRERPKKISAKNEIPMIMLLTMNYHKSLNMLSSCGIYWSIELRSSSNGLGRPICCGRYIYIILYTITHT